MQRESSKFSEKRKEIEKTLREKRADLCAPVDRGLLRPAISGKSVQPKDRNRILGKCCFLHLGVLIAITVAYILAEKPKGYEDFLQKLEQQGYEVKRGKYTSVKGKRQKRVLRFRTLGAGYGEDELKAVLTGEAEHRPRQKCPAPEQKFQMLVDIQAKLAEEKGAGAAVQRVFFEPLSSGTASLPEFKIATNCCSCLRELTPSFS